MTKQERDILKRELRYHILTGNKEAAKAIKTAMVLLNMFSEIQEVEKELNIKILAR